MRIVQMVDVPWDSGLAHYALVLGQGLKKEGHHVYVSAVPGEKPWLKARRLGLHTVPLATFKGLRPLREFLKKHKIDLLNAHTGNMHSLAVAGALGQPVAVVRTRSDARGVRRRVGAGFLFKHTDRVIAAADYIRAAYLSTLKLPSSKVATVYQGVALDEFAPAPLPYPPVLGLVARLDPVKGHRYLLEAVSLLKDTYPSIKVRIMGQDENVKQRDLRVMAGRLRIDDRVEFKGFETNVPKAMAQCTIGVIPSTSSEAVSRVALEWMAAGRPVVATRVGCLPEMVEDGVTGFLVEPKNAPSLAGGLAQLLHNRTKMEAMGRNARQRAETLFGMPRFIQETLHVYDAALREASRSS